MKQKRGREDPCSICQHYHDFEGGEPCSICGHKLVQEQETLPTPSTLPTELIPGFLFVGSYDHASRAELLKTLGINHVLNTVPTCSNLYKNSFNYHTVSTNPPSLEECYAYLQHVQASQGKVLLHCMSGTSRSPTIAMYFIMKSLQKSLEEAYRYVKSKRPSISISDADAERIESAEVQLFGVGRAPSCRVPRGKHSPSDGVHSSHSPGNVGQVINPTISKNSIPLTNNSDAHVHINGGMAT